MDSRVKDNIHLVRLDPGDKIMECITGYLEGKEDEIPSGFLTGIGAVSQAEIGWYDLSEEVYKTTVINENCEITTLIGNIAWVEGKPIAHVHITLGREDYSIIGGHLIEGTISITCEIWIQKAPFLVGRKGGMFEGLKLIDFG